MKLEVKEYGSTVGRNKKGKRSRGQKLSNNFINEAKRNWSRLSQYQKFRKKEDRMGREMGEIGGAIYVKNKRGREFYKKIR